VSKVKKKRGKGANWHVLILARMESSHPDNQTEASSLDYIAQIGNSWRGYS